ncbi:MAG: glycosyltransferase [Mollicutes bacterium]|nr:glycosyltransferase [Mollicutes bacterium]
MKDKILFISNIYPSKNYSGGILLQQLVDFLLEEKHKVYCYKISNQKTFEELYDDAVQSIESFNSIYCNNINKTTVKKITKRLLTFIKKNKITKIFIPVQGELIVKVAKLLIDKGCIPVYIEIWDPIEWVLHDLNYEKSKQKEILKEFDYIVKKATKVFAASLPMQRIYKNKYNINPGILFTSTKAVNYTYQESNNSDFNILFSGQAYSTDAIKNFLIAIDELEWKYAGKKIKFSYYGSNKIDFVPKKIEKKIMYKGYVSQEELMNQCNKADLLYCPYFFSQEPVFKKIAMESFPSKIVTYIPAKTPIIIHAPEYSSVYGFFSQSDGAFLLNSLEKDKIKQMIKDIIKCSDKKKLQIVNESMKLFNKHFLPTTVKKQLLSGLGIKYNSKNKIKVLEVNNVDLPGKRFNGYDIMEYANSNSDLIVNQIVTYKTSNNKNVYKFYNNYQLEHEYSLLSAEDKVLSVHSNLSLISNTLSNSDLYKKSDIIHFHLIHNTKLSLYSLLKYYKEKKVIVSIHDPWNFTGRCVHYESCNKWKTGCKNCPNLKSLFPLKEDNCHFLWKLKKNIYKSMNPHIIVASQYMYDLVRQSPLTNHFTNVHLINFGVDLEQFNNKISQNKARKRFGINSKACVLFFRSQDDFKGTNYIIEALEKIETTKKIVIMTCSQKGNLKSLYTKYKVIELGNVNTQVLINAYRACDLFLMPSIGESFGMMAIEAMACERPVIVFDNTATPSVTCAPDIGILVKNKDSHDLMKKIKYYIENDEERLKRGTLSYQYAVENYDINEYYKKIINLYKLVDYEKQDELKQDYLSSKDCSLKEINQIKGYLNKCTRFMKKSSFFYKQMLFKMDSKTTFVTFPDFSKNMIQEVINEYNNKYYEYVKQTTPCEGAVSDIKPPKMKKPRRKIKPIVWSKKFLYYKKHNPKRLENILKYEFRNHKLILKIINNYYKK